MNKILAYFMIEPDWYYEIYHTNDPRPQHRLTDEDRNFLSDYKSKNHMRWDLEKRNINLHTGLIPLKDGINILKGIPND